MWYEGNYRRIFLDMHIDDWNEEFLSKVDGLRLLKILVEILPQRKKPLIKLLQLKILKLLNQKVLSWVVYWHLTGI